MFNVGGGELIVIMLIALVVLGPQRLPGAARQVGKTLGDLRRLSTGFQNEVRTAFQEADDPDHTAARRNVLAKERPVGARLSADPEPVLSSEGEPEATPRPAARPATSASASKRPPAAPKGAATKAPAKKATGGAKKATAKKATGGAKKATGGAKKATAKQASASKKAATQPRRPSSR